jgi:hypothetical protein
MECSELDFWIENSGVYNFDYVEFPVTGGSRINHCAHIASITHNRIDDIGPGSRGQRIAAFELVGSAADDRTEDDGHLIHLSGDGGDRGLEDRSGVVWDQTGDEFEIVRVSITIIIPFRALGQLILGGPCGIGRNHHDAQIRGRRAAGIGGGDGVSGGSRARHRGGAADDARDGV